MAYVNVELLLIFGGGITLLISLAGASFPAALMDGPQLDAKLIIIFESCNFFMSVANVLLSYI